MNYKVKHLPGSRLIVSGEECYAEERWLVITDAPASATAVLAAGGLPRLNEPHALKERATCYSIDVSGDWSDPRWWRIFSQFKTPGWTPDMLRSGVEYLSR
jgi:hypothetical protein